MKKREMNNPHSKFYKSNNKKLQHKCTHPKICFSEFSTTTSTIMLLTKMIRSFLSLSPSLLLLLLLIFGSPHCLLANFYSIQMIFSLYDIFHIAVEIHTIFPNANQKRAHKTDEQEVKKKKPTIVIHSFWSML